MFLEKCWTATREFLGSGIPESDARRLAQLRDASPTETVVEEMQRILDQYVLVRRVTAAAACRRVGHTSWTSR